MMRLVRKIFALLVFAAVFSNAPGLVYAQVILTNSPSKLVGIGAGIAAVGAGIGIAIYAAAHHKHRLNGCAIVTPTGLTLMNRGDRQAYGLVGEISEIQQGDRVRVSGKKSTGNGKMPRQFLVEKLERDYGACGVQDLER